MRRLIVSLICSALVSLPAAAHQKTQPSGQSEREVKVHIEGKEVDAGELLQQLNARGAKKHLKFVETKEGFDYKMKVETVATGYLGQAGFVGANVVVENNKGESLFFYRGPGRFTGKRALDAAAQEIIKKLTPYLTGKED